MTKIKPFLIVFMPAYLLSRILMDLFSFIGFSFNNPNLLTLLFDLVIWFASWGVAYIVYVTVFRGGRAKLVEVEEKADEIS